MTRGPLISLAAAAMVGALAPPARAELVIDYLDLASDPTYRVSREHVSQDGFVTILLTRQNETLPTVICQFHRDGDKSYPYDACRVLGK